MLDASDILEELQALEIDWELVQAEMTHHTFDDPRRNGIIERFSLELKFIGERFTSAEALVIRDGHS